MQSKSMDCFLYDKDIGHERLNLFHTQVPLIFSTITIPEICSLHYYSSVSAVKQISHFSYVFLMSFGVKVSRIRDLSVQYIPVHGMDFQWSRLLYVAWSFYCIQGIQMRQSIQERTK